MNRIAAYLNPLPEEEARGELRRCCGAQRWIEGMLRERPFADDETVLATADRIWWQLDPDAWREAFSHHPRIGGDLGPAGDTRAWSRREQAAMETAADATRAALVEGNREYERRFGYVFLICATGRNAEEMLRELERRMAHGPEEEIRVAAAEQARITGLRLQKLPPDSEER